MSHSASPSAKRVYGAVRVLRVWELPRSTFHHRRGRAQQPLLGARRRGPKTAWSDVELTEKIRAVIVESPFHAEGHRKVWARLRSISFTSSCTRIGLDTYPSMPALRHRSRSPFMA